MGSIIDKLCKKRNYEKVNNQIDCEEYLQVEDSETEQKIFEEEYDSQLHFLQFIPYQQFQQSHYDYKSVFSQFAATLVSYGNQSQNTILNNTSVARINKQIKLMSRILPVNQSNSIFVCVNQNNLLQMEALIFGSQGTPYEHGAFLYRLQLPVNYPNEPPVVDLLTTGYGRIRFNPNLYQTGYVCLSLLGTWSGSGGENWQPQKSNIAQVLISIQTLVMNEKVFFNEPSYEDFQQSEYQSHNRGYQNIVKYGNIVYAMIEALKNPPKRFQKIIKTHFYLKRNKIMKNISKWIQQSQLPSNYSDLTQSHNYQFSRRYTINPFGYRNDLIRSIQKLHQILKDLKLQDTLISCQKNENKHQSVRV